LRCRSLGPTAASAPWVGLRVRANELNFDEAGELPVVLTEETGLKEAIKRYYGFASDMIDRLPVDKLTQAMQTLLSLDQQLIGQDMAADAAGQIVAGAGHGLGPGFRPAGRVVGHSGTSPLFARRRPGPAEIYEFKGDTYLLLAAQKQPDFPGDITPRVLSYWIESVQGVNKPLFL